MLLSSAQKKIIKKKNNKNLKDKENKGQRKTFSVCENVLKNQQCQG